MAIDDSTAAPIVVVGAGAAGLMAATFAARSGQPVLLCERTADGGRKIVISGGGRCNILPSTVDPSLYVSDSAPRIVRHILRSWPLADQWRFFENEAGIRLRLEAESGKLFPASNDARGVRDRLVQLAREAGVHVRFSTRVVRLEPPPGGAGPWTVGLDGGETLCARAVVLASGGLSVPATGSDGGGFEIARALGHTMHRTYPALTPLVADPPLHAHLSGVSLEVTIEAPLGRRKALSTGGFLFTHLGYSGPAILNISHLAVRSQMDGRPAQPLFVRWTGLDTRTWEQALVPAPGLVMSILRDHLPARLASALMDEAGIPDTQSASTLRRDERARLVERLTRYSLPWTGHEGYKKAEVTGGGVALEDIDPHTLESRVHRGLFLCGEVLDAFGPIGGYNFVWAWATGRAAGLGATAEQRA
jgi:predicted Rossmann fold flavoprotein